MDSLSSNAFLLATVNTNQFQKLGQCIWGWNLCGNCSRRPECDQATCPWSRARRLQIFWDRYADLTERYVPEFGSEGPALSSHEDLLNIIQLIKAKPNTNREDLMRQLFLTTQSVTNRASASDQNRSMNIAASILLLSNCGTSYECADFLEDGGTSISWDNEKSVSMFVSQVYPARTHPYFDMSSNLHNTMNVIEAVAALKLADRGITLEPTQDLRSHLTLEYQKRKKVLRIFHCPAVLKEILLASQADPNACLIPRAMALEVLDTIYKVLFPPDVKSQKLLSSLVRKYRFDKDLLHYDMARYRRDDDPIVSYSYYGTQLASLYDELQNPTPRPGWESWFQKYSSPRYMIMATMVGVFIAVILGVLGLGVAGFQAWLTYQQWKHPVKES
ncbi:hypothetical protein IQ07DRAFT_406671 [Pyrenochaeta sp. DS3sAY3a]|nr:hypothetical protein IQ07DRAFT_406671 [Pyrenochaeta sp. DS3sAY3a]